MHMGKREYRVCVCVCVFTHCAEQESLYSVGCRIYLCVRELWATQAQSYCTCHTACSHGCRGGK